MFGPLQFGLAERHLEWQRAHHWAWLKGWVLQSLTQNPSQLVGTVSHAHQEIVITLTAQLLAGVQHWYP